jgi:hypothetical protein
VYIACVPPRVEWYFISISYLAISFHVIGIILMHTSHSCIIVTETPEDAPVEPTEIVETEPGAECVVEQKENQGKQLSMIP